MDRFILLSELESLLSQFNKIQLAVQNDFTINWQNDLIPGTSKKFVDVFGNKISDIRGIYDDNGTMRPYIPDWSFSKAGAEITTITLSGIFPGTITII